MKRWQHPAGFEIEGFSRAGEATGFYIPQRRWLLDCGVVENHIHARRLFLTHGHLDHTQLLPSFVSAYFLHGQKAEIYAPVQTVDLIERFISAALELNAHGQVGSGEAVPYTLTGVSPGDRLTVKGKKKAKYQVEVVACHHRVPSVGYIFSDLRTKLKERYRGLPGAEIGRLRRAGEEVSDQLMLPLLSFLGDTSSAVFDQAPQVLDAKVVLAECSFLEPEHMEAARRTFHTHFDDLREVIAARRDVTFLLNHFSLRYRDEEVLSFFDSLDKQAFGHIVPWV